VLFGTTSLFIPQGGKHSQGVFSPEPEKFSGTAVSAYLNGYFRPLEPVEENSELGGF
jgi:hypothetical protein